MKKLFAILGVMALSTTAFGQSDTENVHIPDARFKKKLVENYTINTNRDREISYGEARAYKGALNVGYSKIADLTGIEAFVNIVSLNCSSNRLTSLDVSQNKALKILWCDTNQLPSLDVSQNMELVELLCQKNRLPSLDVSKNTALTEFGCSNNLITSIDVSQNKNLVNFNCSNNLLTDIDVSGNQLLEKLFCTDNQLSSLDVSENTLLSYLYCSNNPLKQIDVSKNVLLSYLKCDNNQLTSLDLSKNTLLEVLWCNDNQLKTIDLSKNKALIYLDIYNNQLTQLNIANGNNNAILSLNATENPSLTCIQIDAGFTPTNVWQKDTTASFSDNCNYNLSAQETKILAYLEILNPVKDNLIFNTSAKIEKVEIYNAVGQLVKVLQNGTTQVQDLAKGIYIAKITTNNGVVTKKIVKE